MPLIVFTVSPLAAPMINAAECPICYEILTPQNNPEIELCNNQHTACTNCARKLANQAIAQGMDPRCMMCRAPITVSNILVNPIDAALHRLREEPSNPNYWAQLGLTLGTDEHVIFQGKAYSKQRCFNKAAKLSA